MEYTESMVEPSRRDPGIHLFGRPLGLVLLVLYKAIWGAFEVAAGILIMLSYRVLSGELTEDPQDLFATWLFAHLGVEHAYRIGAIVLLLGITKIVIAVGVWYRSWLLRDGALIFFGMAAIYGCYEVLLHFSIFKLGALVMDLFLLWYFWKILPKHLHDRKVS
jgi:uncharacterized membrane protein